MTRRLNYLLNFRLGACGAFSLALAGALLGAQLVRAADPVEPPGDDPHMKPVVSVTQNRQDDGYRGVWYMNQPSKDEYKYKYSGGLGTYCDYHQPFSVYAPEVDKTFFCYGGTSHDSPTELWHMISYFDHKTGTVPKPTFLLDKQTSDAHDNPVLSIDKDGYIWVFSSSHGLGRPSYIHRSAKPYDIAKFEQLSPTRIDGKRSVPLDNYSYPQFWYDKDRGFVSFFTRYSYPAARTSCFMTSDDGIHWSEWQRLAAIGEGHYQVSGVGKKKLSTMMNYHPQGKGLNWRTNLYYLETEDDGKTWHAANGAALKLPLTDPKNPALVRDYEAENQLVYIKDLVYDENENPILVYETSGGFEPGPENGPRELCIAHWTGKKWEFKPIANVDHNYDSASLYLEDDDVWRLIAPTEPGPQAFCTGGEMVIWRSEDQGKSWKKERQLTADSPRNHTYARRPVNAHPDFYAFWADGNAKEPSESRLYFSDRDGNVFQLPREIRGETAKPRRIDALVPNRKEAENGTAS